MAVDALDWLLAHGADVHAEEEAALIAGIASLDEITVDMLLKAGADLALCGELAFGTALTSRPHDLYSDESDLIDLRASMVVWLLGQGMRPAGPNIVDSLRREREAKRIIDAVLNHAEISAGDTEWLRALATQA